MPYYRRKRAYRRRRYRKKSNTRAIARRVVKKELAKNLERKYVMRDVNSVPVDYNGLNTLTGLPAVYELYPTTRGTGPFEYIGQKVKVTGVSVRYQIFAKDTTNLFRVIVAQWKGAGAATPTIDDVLRGVGTVYAPIELYENQIRSRFKILYNRLHNVALGQSNEQAIGKIWIPGTRLRVVDYGTVSGDVQDGELLLYVISDSPIANHPLFSARIKIYFTDA